MLKEKQGAEEPRALGRRGAEVFAFHSSLAISFIKKSLFFYMVWVVMNPNQEKA